MKIGDIIEVRRYVDKSWYKGTNLTTKRKGIFPIAYVKEVEISSTNAVEPLSGGHRRAASQSRISEKLLVEMPKETERKGSFFYPTDTVIVRDRGNRTTSTGYQEINQDIILIRPKDTLNNEPAKIVRQTVEEDVTIIKPRRAIEPPTVVDEKIIIPIRRKEISLGEISQYANSTPEVDIEHLRAYSRPRSDSRARSGERRIIVEKREKDVVERPVVVERPRPREIVIEQPREIEEASTVISQHSRPRSRSVKEVRVQEASIYNAPQQRREYKALPPPQTITYNKYGAPVLVDTKTFAPAPAMSVPPRPYYSQKALEPAPVPVLPQSYTRVYEYH
ncbi:hypothetical protein ABW20_dc0103305 [Dactylellina cionopaga]|nr:hypothetical protein ABW20_dc0103305 [Dactylellina cionopaga]